MDPREFLNKTPPETDGLTEVRARAYLNLVGLAKLAGDLHQENRELRDELESCKRLYSAKNRMIRALFDKVAAYHKAIELADERAGGLGAVRDLVCAIKEIDRNNPTIFSPQNEN